MKVDIGIIGAMAIEVEELCSLLADETVELVSGVEMHIGFLCGRRVVIARCGVGKVFAALCAEAMIIKYSPELIINTGVGGALAAGLKTGDVVIANKLLQYDMDTSAVGDRKGLISGINKIYFDADPSAVKILSGEAESLSLSYRVGTVATGDKFIASREDKENILSHFPEAQACEMEGGAIAHVAFVNGVRFAVIRGISDSADGEATMDFPTFLPIAAKNSAALTLALVNDFKA